MVETIDVESRPTTDLARDQFQAMATTVEVLWPAASAITASGLDAVIAVFARVEAACTRFDASSALMTANAAPDDWHIVPRDCWGAVAAAHQAYEMTDGLFDPRILRSLAANGYDRSLPFRSGPVHLSAPGLDEGGVPSAPPRTRWVPQFDASRGTLRLGPDPIDLGGIGKGYAVMQAVDELLAHGRSFLINAGGDCYAHGFGPDGSGWLVGVEDPHGGGDPLAVLSVANAACATSSTRLRRWTVDGALNHHLIDPRTGRPGGEGLSAVTVVATDTVTAEVWSKALFLSGPEGIEPLARARGLAALWVHDDGSVHSSPALSPSLRWQVSRDR